MQQKRHLENLLHLCSDEAFGQEAVEWAVLNGHVQLTYDLERDLRTIVGEPGKPETGRYDEFCAGYRAESRQNEAVLVGLYQQTGFLDEILKPQVAA